MLSSPHLGHVVGRGAVPWLRLGGAFDLQHAWAQACQVHSPSACSQQKISTVARRHADTKVNDSTGICEQYFHDLQVCCAPQLKAASKA